MSICAPGKKCRNLCLAKLWMQKADLTYSKDDRLFDDSLVIQYLFYLNQYSLTCEKLH